MAACLVKAKKLKEAVMMFEKALRLNPTAYNTAFEYFPPMQKIAVFINMVDQNML
jgi:tetratricopeptide (TPR) repeat protein